MTVETAPEWLVLDPVLLATWDARGESVSSIADRLLANLRGIDDSLSAPGDWTTIAGDPVALDSGQLERQLLTGVWTDDFGVAFPDYGYALSLVNDQPDLTVKVRIDAGSRVPGRHIPANGVSIDFRPHRGGVSARVVEDILLATVRAWDPASAAVRDDAAAEAAEERSPWAPVVGQRTWVPQQLSAHLSSPTVRVEAASPGTLLASGDALGAEESVRVISSLLAEHMVTHIPRGLV